MLNCTTGVSLLLWLSVNPVWNFSNSVIQSEKVPWYTLMGSKRLFYEYRIPTLTFIPHESKYFLVFSDIIYMVLATTSMRTFRLLTLKQREIPKKATNGKTGLFPFGRLLISNFYIFFDSLPILLL